MRIAIDGGCWSNRRGYGRFLHEIVRELARLGGGHEYVVLLDRPSFPTFSLGPPFQPVLVETHHAIADAAAAGSSRSLADLARMSLAVARLQPDLMFFPSVYSYFPVVVRCPVIVCIHDTIPERDPSLHFDSWRERLAWQTKVRFAIEQSARVVTVSEHSKRSLREFLGVPGESVRVVYEAASPEFSPLPAEPPERPYFLYVGGFSPHKNLDRLVRAFARLQRQFADVKLILAGDYQGDSFKGSHAGLARLVNELSLDAGVSFPGFVPDSELRRLYSGATAVVLLSMDEGFGLPALEAMACGTPVVVSRGNAMEEVASGGGLLVDSDDEAGVAAAMARLLQEPELVRRLREKALARASEFSWERSARQLLAVFDEFSGSR